MTRLLGQTVAGFFSSFTNWKKRIRILNSGSELGSFLELPLSILPKYNLSPIPVTVTC